jgi:DNA repair protein RadD
MALTLRPYQQEAVDSVFDYWKNQAGNPLVILPTGSGKSLVMADLMKRLIAGWPGMRLACVTHVRELIEQNHKELIGVWPAAPAGIYSAGIGRRDTRAQILFCGIQSVRDKAALLGHIDIIFVDECHLIPTKAETNYGVFLRDMSAINPDLKIVGLTATPFRLDSGRLDEGDVRMFDGIAYEAQISDLIEQGYLSPLVTKATQTVLDVSKVHKLGGEFNLHELQLAVNVHEVTQAAVSEIIAFGQTRKSWLVFCSGVEHAYAIAHEMRSRGVNCETITGQTQKDDRDNLIRMFRAGEIRCLTNANVLTTGFNAPGVDMLAMLRPTLSPSLYVQMVGRGSRNAPAKKNCLILDFAGNIFRHGPIDQVKAKRPGHGDAPVKICPECGTIHPISVMVCSSEDPPCDYIFPANEDEKPKHDATASSAPIISKDKPQWVRVTDRRFYRHDKPGGTPSVRVDFRCGLTVHKLWICPEHNGFARQKFVDFWRRHGGDDNPPDSVDLAVMLCNEPGVLGPTGEIQVKPDGKWMSVVGYRPSLGGTSP